MIADRSYVPENQTQRARLKVFVAGRSDADLARPMPAGWTVAAVLAHLAFWDQRALVLLEQWEKTSAIPRANSEEDVDWINDAAKPMFLALPPRRAAELALSIAEAVDAKVAGLSDDLVGRNAAAGTPVNLFRATHRREHLDEIERALTSRSPRTGNRVRYRSAEFDAAVQGGDLDARSGGGEAGVRAGGPHPGQGPAGAAALQLPLGLGVARAATRRQHELLAGYVARRRRLVRCGVTPTDAGRGR